MTRTAMGVELRQGEDSLWYVYRGGVPVKGAKFVLQAIGITWCKSSLKAKTVNIVPFACS